MTKRLRCLGYLVQPQFVVDDGDTLTPISVQPINVTPADWPNVVDGVAEAVAALQAQIDAETPATPNRVVRRANGKAKTGA